MNAKTLRRMAALLGYDWSDEELEALLPQVEKSLEMVERLDALALRDVEPALQYRIL
ncbi:MAG: Asp-tRNA(Asn)/Glu-tRNA(Gln) amidotransferase subunit GatC [Candidatus Rokuibacteriota bacterium]